MESTPIDFFASHGVRFGDSPEDNAQTRGEYATSRAPMIDHFTFLACRLVPMLAGRNGSPAARRLRHRGGPLWPRCSHRFAAEAAR